MLQLTDREWAEFRVGDIFDINKCDYGKDNKYNMTANIRDMPVVSGQTTNNGVVGYVKRSDITSKIYKDCLTISTRGQYSGTVLYHEGEFVLNNNIMILALKHDMPRYVKIFMQVPLSNLGYGGYGNYPKRDEIMRREIFLPVDANGQPDYEFMEQYIREREPDYSWATGCIEPDVEISLRDREWAEFKVGDIFNFTRGKRITTDFASENTGEIPVIAGGEQNNGILCYLDESCKATRVLKDSCISVAAYGTAGCVHYHGYKCFIDDKAIALNIKQRSFDNKPVNLFMVAVLSSLQSRYSYGRGVTVDRYSNETIRLPVDANGQPDYEFMEQYIKSLPFSKVLE